MAQPNNNQQHSPLFKLRAELRNQIYEMAFTYDNDKEETIKIIDAFTLAKKFRSDDRGSDVRYSLPPLSSALLRSCQLVYLEAKKRHSLIGVYRTECVGRQAMANE